MKGNRSVSVYTGSLKLEIQIGSLSRNPRNAWCKIFLQPSGPHSERATTRQFVRRIVISLQERTGKKKSHPKTKVRNLYEFSFTVSWLFENFIREKSHLSCVSPVPRGSQGIREQRSECPGRRETQSDASYSNAWLETEYSLMLISRSEVLGARRCSVARVGAVQGMLCEEAAVVLVNPTRPECRAPRELDPGPVLRLELGLHRRRRPFQIPSHIACCRSLRRCRLSLVHRCWCLRIKNT